MQLTMEHSPYAKGGEIAIEEDDHGDKKKLECAECHRRIAYGADLITTEPGVYGPRGIVDLGHKLVFCSETCVGLYYSGNGSESRLAPTARIVRFDGRIDRIGVHCPRPFRDDSRSR